jgi:hypothetical protein
MSKQTFVITPKNYPRALEVLGEHAEVDPLNGLFVLVLLIFAIQVKYDVSRSSQLGIAFGILFFLAGYVIGGVMVAHGQSVVGRIRRQY